MFLHLIDRKTAKQHKLKRYFTGKPCKHGHICERFAFGGCHICMLKFKSDEAYKQKNREYAKEYSRKHPERKKENFSRHYAENREYHLRRRREYRLKHKQIELEKGRAEKRTKRDYYHALTVKRRADKLKATPSWDMELTTFVMKEAHNLCRMREELFGFKWAIDHMIPLKAKTVCGLHVWNNLQCLPDKMNASKLNKLIFTEPFEWLHHIQNYFQILTK